MKGFIIIVFLFVFSLGFSQQESQFTQYMYNTTLINPAYAGSRDVLSIFGQYRTQWIGLNGAPETTAFSIHSPINLTNVGLGFSVINENIGPTNDATISGDFSYTIPTSERFKLAFGLKASVSLFSLNANELNIFQPEDPTIQNISAKGTPNIGVGLYWYSDKAYFGMSSPIFFERTRYNDNDFAIYEEKLTYYLMGGYVFDLQEDWQFKPAFLVKNTYGAPMQVDVSANFQAFEKITFGGAWRNSGTFSALVGFQLSPTLFLGYGYDAETTKLARYNSGSHEFFIRFEIPPVLKKIVSPRFF
uniref:PorP/SprF family type IX secretion system membrane protein n=1 Tax=Flavobacterium sp. TaxID=239 RepID=UPI00404AB86C